MEIRFLRSMVSHGADRRIGDLLEVEPTPETRYVVDNGWAEAVTDEAPAKLVQRVVKSRKRRVTPHEE